MKTSRLVSVILLGAALMVASPMYAQRGGGSSHSSSSSSSSRSSSSFSGGSRSSSGGSVSRSSSGLSGSSRSSSSSRSGSGSSSSSHSGSSFSRSSSGSSSSSVGSSSGSSSRGFTSSSSNGLRGSGSVSGYSGNSGQRAAATQSGSVQAPEQKGTTTGRGNASRVDSPTYRTGNPTNRSNNTSAGEGRPNGTPQPGVGPRPPHHPDPYFMHPHHHVVVHCHQLFWDPFPPRHIYWPGFWLYCDNYWYDYHVTDMALVRRYVKDTYTMDLVAYAKSGDYLYALVNDPDGHTYIQVYDKNDKLLAEQQVSRRYIKMEVDPQNGGCWIMKKRDKDPLLFYYVEGELLIYEADK